MKCNAYKISEVKIVLSTVLWNDVRRRYGEL